VKLKYSVKLQLLILSPIYPISLNLIMMSIFYSGIQLDRITNLTLAVIGGSLVIVLVGLLLPRNKLLLWSIFCVLSHLTYWYLLSPFFKGTGNYLGDFVAWYGLILSVLVPIILGWCAQRYLTRRPSKDAQTTRAT
jgi:hypothetical protein